MKNWNNIGLNYFPSNDALKIDNIPPAIYLLKYDQRLGMYLQRQEDSFAFSHKIYGKDTVFVDRCKKTFENTSNNLGILLSGIKGTGKSVTAKLLCNNFEKPVILITEEFEGIDEFLFNIDQEVVVFVDEYEKIFEKSHQLLSVMDGGTMSPYRRIFILTTNSIFVNENLLNRPSRIRYHRQYGNLEKSVCQEIIDDRLINKDFTDDLLDVISKLEHVTIDLVISLINEINIHNEPASTFEKIFNAEYTTVYVDVLDEEDKIIYARVKFESFNILKNPTRYINYRIYLEDMSEESVLLGEFKKIEEGLYYFKVDNKTKLVKYKIVKHKNLTYAY